MPACASFEALAEFVRAKTAPGDRLLVQTRLKCEPQALALGCGREVIGSSYPDSFDPVQFDSDRLLGRRLGEWTEEELREALRRWGIAWAVAWTPEAKDLLTRAAGQPGETADGYRVFRLPDPGGRFLVGAGETEAEVNRIRLRGVVASNNVAVLRYRFHPAWDAGAGGRVFRWPTPEDPAGFIGIENPTREVTLRFNPRRMTFAFGTAEPPESVCHALGLLQ
jgi:hypothetical protein